MPIYEFYCPDCNTLFNFFSKTINTSKKPKCPQCKTRTLDRQMSAFAFTGKAKEAGDGDDLPFDEGKMEKAMQMLAGEADRIDEDDPRALGCVNGGGQSVEQLLGFEYPADVDLGAP